MTYLTHLECSLCNKSYSADELANLCPDCSRPLLARYDLAAARAEWDRDILQTRESTMWRYREVLPVRDSDTAITRRSGPCPRKIEIGPNAINLGESVIILANHRHMAY